MNMSDTSRRSVLGWPLLMAAAAQSQDNGAVSDDKALRFWREGIARPEYPLPEGFGIAPQSKVPSYERDPIFVYVDKTGMRRADKLEPDSLPDGGDVTANIRIVHFRPSRADRELLHNFPAAAVRLDVGQQKTLPGLSEVLGWATIAGLAGPPLRSKKLAFTDLSQLAFRPAASQTNSQKIVLPDGLGWCTLNAFVKKKDSMWGSLLASILSSALKVGVTFAPVLTMPAIARSSILQLDELIGQMHHQGGGGDFIFQSANVEFCCTRAAAKKSTGEAVRLKSGTYLMVPRAHLDELSGAAAKFEVDRGLLVPKGTDEFGLYKAAENTLPDMTYLAVAVSVSPQALCKCAPKL